jgi:hypothetical protein
MMFLGESMGMKLGDDDDSNEDENLFGNDE